MCRVVWTRRGRHVWRPHPPQSAGCGSADYKEGTVFSYLVRFAYEADFASILYFVYFACLVTFADFLTFATRAYSLYFACPA